MIHSYNGGAEVGHFTYLCSHRRDGNRDLLHELALDDEILEIRERLDLDLAVDRRAAIGREVVVAREDECRINHLIFESSADSRCHEGLDRSCVLLEDEHSACNRVLHALADAAAQ